MVQFMGDVVVVLKHACGPQVNKIIKDRNNYS